jgi:hypothetical protein
MITAQIISVWWNGMISRRLNHVLIMIFRISLSNPKPIISLARNNNLLDNMPFCHLTQYCRSNKAVDIARILKVSTSPAGIKYKFGIQVPKGIKNDLWQEAIKTELEQLTNYQTFIIQDSGEDIPTGYQKIPYRMVLMSNMI